MASPTKGRSRARGASVGAILGAAAVLAPASCGEDSEGPPYDPDFGGALDFDAVAPHDGEPDSTLVDLDGEVDASRVHPDGGLTGPGGGPHQGGDAEVS